MKARLVLWSLVTDVVSVIVFVAIGRRNHDESTGLDGIFSTAAPFLIALVVTWLLTLVWRDPLSNRSGVTVWIGTVSLGMVLRNLVFDDGTATAFVIVATVFLGLTVNSWRALARKRLSGAGSSPIR